MRALTFDPDNLRWPDLIKLTVWLGIYGGVATLVRFKWVDLFDWPLTWERALVDGVVILASFLLLVVVWRIWRGSPVETGVVVQPQENFWKDTLQWTVPIGPFAAWGVSALLRTPWPGGTAQYRAFVVGVALGTALGLVGAAISARKAARTRIRTPLRADEIATPILLFVFLGGNSFMYSAKTPPAIWWTVFLGPVVLVSTYYVILRLQALHEPGSS